jgi:protein TonB
VIAREPVGARRLGFTGGAVAVHALVVWVALRPPSPRPPVPVDVLLVRPGAMRELLLPPPAQVSPRAQQPAGKVPATSRRPAGPRRLIPPNAPVSASAPPLEATDPADLPPLTADAVAFSGIGGDPYRRFPRSGGGPDGGIAPAGAQASEWLVLHKREIVRRIQERASRRPYPALAAAMGWTGVVRVAFTLRTDGTVADLRVVKTSGRRALDECALDDVRASVPFPRPSEEQAVEVPIVYVLT